MIKWTVFFFIYIQFLYSVVSDSATFGPFNMVITSFTVCSGPKIKNCTSVKINVTGDTTIDVYLKVIKTCAPTKGKISTSSNGKELARFQMNKPCEHLFLRPLLTAMYNATKNCQILKGDYWRKVDIGAITNNYFGGRFFYGNITFRAHLYNEECNFSCIILKVSMTPKK